MAKPADSSKLLSSPLSNYLSVHSKETIMKYSKFLFIPDLTHDDLVELEQAKNKLKLKSGWVCDHVSATVRNKIKVTLDTTGVVFLSTWYFTQTGEYPDNPTEYRIQWINWLIDQYNRKDQQ